MSQGGDRADGVTGAGDRPAQDLDGVVRVVGDELGERGAQTSSPSAAAQR
ncbi:hypothetical protein [Janibacter melonis]|nr:hypothetical protein [Janibacter melonis]